ncbi:hypothetical protein [Pararhizobium sp. PWRC1-1]|uniref:hypothetical protein n=1 Tax=Pararhizobium sp. PWRC1-1 TaxID=2804566 RepID=UPI003CF917CE
MSMQNATKVLIAALTVILSFASFAEARDRSGERHQFRRTHFERSHDQRPHHQRRDRSETVSGINAGHWYRDDRRRGRNSLAGRMDRRQYYERRYGHRYDRDRGIVVRQYREQRGNGWDQSYGGDGFPSHANGGTYFGGLSAWTDPGNGTYFSSERNGYGFYSGDTGINYPAARPKIIRVTPSTAGRACSWESGVCVIRR